MQTFLKVLGFVTIFIGIIIGIVIISQSLNDYAVARSTNDLYMEQIYVIKLVAGAAIIMLSVVSGILYLSFGMVIELLDSINHKLTPVKKKDEIEEFTA
jgi:vacuolar-type H+-ATPase subunit I/STV1